MKKYKSIIVAIVLVFSCTWVAQADIKENKFENASSKFTQRDSPTLREGGLGGLNDENLEEFGVPVGDGLCFLVFAGICYFAVQRCRGKFRDNRC
jgi:hypothetical protein